MCLETLDHQTLKPQRGDIYGSLKTTVYFQGKWYSNIGVMLQQDALPIVFDLKGQDEFSDQLAISTTMDIVKRLLQYPKVTARQIVGLGHALYALECLPAVTPGVWVEFGVILDVTGRFRDETTYIYFRISEEEFEISRSGYIDLGAGWDSYSDTGWYFDIHGNRNAECQLWWLEDEILDLLGCGAEIRVDDESHIDFSEV